MTTLFIALLAGVGLGLLTWYGWAIAENVNAMRRRRKEEAAESEEET